MKRIYNTETGKTTWRGAEYIVDGVVIDEVEMPLVMLTDHVIDDEFNPATETRDWVDRPALLIGQWERGWEKRPLTTEELAARAPQPHAVTRRQFWLAIYQSDGITRAMVKDMLTLLPGDHEASFIELEEALEIDPNHQLTQSLAQGLGKSPEAVAALFIHAATL